MVGVALVAATEVANATGDSEATKLVDIVAASISSKSVPLQGVEQPDANNSGPTFSNSAEVTLEAIGVACAEIKGWDGDSSSCLLVTEASVVMIFE